MVEPASTASPPRVEPAEIAPPSKEELALLLAEAERTSATLHLFLLLAAMTGQRRGELLALRWGDVDFEHANLKIQRSLTEGPEGPVLSTTKTRRTNGVALDAMAAEALAASRSRRSSESAAVDRSIFSSDGGRMPWSANRVTKAFIRCRRAVGLDSFRPHDLRHFMATDMLSNGEPITVVSSRPSHARSSTTLNVYGHVVPGADRSAAEALALRLAPRSPGPATLAIVEAEDAQSERSSHERPRPMSAAGAGFCSQCGSPDARMLMSDDLLCDRCADRLIAAHAGFAELPDPPAPFVVRDAAGAERTLLVRLRRAPSGVVAEVEEPGDPDDGYRRGVLGSHEADVGYLVARLREIVEAELTKRYLEPNPHRAGLLLSSDELEGRLEWSEHGNEIGTPCDVIVDGRKLSWDDLRRALEPFPGFRIRIEITDVIEDLRDDR